MISIVFDRPAGQARGFRVTGHSGYAEAGADIICAAVSSAVQLVVNAVTEHARIPARVTADPDTADIDLRLPEKLTPRQAEDARLLLEAFYTHAVLLSEEYPAFIRVTE